ncbi:hypothetical protein BRCH_03352c [Candidatus Burkholderia brachyanthoides]|nr:hypothetical protein BRCH_03352c [Candidatus Burkholderia brachyanthoides]
MVTRWTLLPPLFSSRFFRRKTRHTQQLAAAYSETPCPGYVETDGGSPFDITAMAKDAGSPQSTLTRIRNAVSRIDAGGECSIFSDKHTCDETLTLAHKAIEALQTCASVNPPKGAAHG